MRFGVEVNPHDRPDFHVEGKWVYIEGKSLVVQISPIESECLELRFDEELKEYQVVHHSIGNPEGGECVFSILEEVEP